MLKKLLLILFIATSFLSSCKKDTGTNVNITPADLGNVNTQLKGSWVYPVETLTILDNNGNAMFPAQNLSAPAFYFDGSSHVDIISDPQTVLHGTYVLSTKSTGGIYVHLNYPDGSTADYQAIMLNSSTLTLTGSEPYVYFHNGALIPTEAVTSTSLQRIGSGTVVNGNLVKVTVKNDSVFSAKVYLTRKADGKTVLMDSISSTNQSYTSVFTAQKDDRIKVDVIGNFLNTYIYAYADGLPIAGNVYHPSSYETITSDGWNVSFPQ